MAESVEQKNILTRAAHEMLERARLEEGEIARRLDSACDAQFWAAMNPQLTVNGGGDVEEQPADGFSLSEILKVYEDDGYFNAGTIFTASLMGRMRQCVETLRRGGWPLVFAFVYDEFWRVWVSPRVARLTGAILGEGYRVVPHHIWVHYVAPQRGSAGWHPHVDNVPGRLTVWIALSDATLDNGCIYLIRRDEKNRKIARNFVGLEGVRKEELINLLQRSRALPAVAGSVLGWDYDVIHWGAASVKIAGGPRISTAMEVAPEFTSSDRLMPSLGAESRLPTLAQRLYVAGKAVLDYQRFEPLMIRHAEFARQLIARVEASESSSPQ